MQPFSRRKGLLNRRKSIARRHEELNLRKWGNHKFDESTGQVFIETTASILSAEERDWTRKTEVLRGLHSIDTQIQSEKSLARKQRRDNRIESHSQKHLGNSHIVSPASRGARSLQDLALTSAIRNIRDVSSESMENLPTHLVRRIWDVVRCR